jgi:hypothetical protein
MIALYPKSSIGHFVFIFCLWAGLFAHIPFWRNIVSIKNWLKEYLSELQSERPFWLSKRGFLCPARIVRIAGIYEDRDGFTECWFPWAIITYHDLEILRNFYLFVWIMFELVEGEVHFSCIVLLLSKVPNHLDDKTGDSFIISYKLRLKTNDPVILRCWQIRLEKHRENPFNEKTPWIATSFSQARTTRNDRVEEMTATSRTSHKC